MNTLKVVADAELEVSNEVLERIREVLGQQEDLIKQRTDFATSETEKLVQTINDLFFKIIPTEGDAKLLEDVYLKIFTRVEEAVRKGYRLHRGPSYDRIRCFGELATKSPSPNVLPLRS